MDDNFESAKCTKCPEYHLFAVYDAAKPGFKKTATGLCNYRRGLIIDENKARLGVNHYRDVPTTRVNEDGSIDKGIRLTADMHECPDDKKRATPDNVINIVESAVA